MECTVYFDLKGEHYHLFVNENDTDYDCVEQKFINAVYDDLTEDDKKSVEDAIVTIVLVYEAKIIKIDFRSRKRNTRYKEQELIWYGIDNLYDFQTAWQEIVNIYDDDDIDRLWQKYGDVIFEYRRLEKLTKDGKDE